MVCQRCGRTTASSGTFCSTCGARLTVGEVTSPSRTADSGGTDATRLAERYAADGEAVAARGDAEATRLLDPDETRLIGSGPADDPDGTRLAPRRGPGASHRPPLVADGDHGPLAVGQVFGSRYHIIRLLGIGGMGAVYQAWDTELAVAVAIKVIRPEVMADPKTAAEIERRFKRELLLARQVTHRNVVRIHDLGDIGGIKYITMSYVDGSDLATVLTEAGRLPPARALRIARSVVAGLVEAHKAGIVHRDLKPANIMIDADDQALIMDFGIARSTGRPVAGEVPGNTTIVNNLRMAAEGPADATVLGAVIGTVQYMAPEQARGAHIDQRADIYAFGLIVYDMLAGQTRAHRAGSAIAELERRMQQPPPSVRSLAPEVPVALEQVVSRCLEPDPARRYQTTQELADALAWLNEKGERIRVRRVVGMRLFAAAILLSLALVGGVWRFAQGPAVPVQHENVSVLIADFENASNDPSFDRTLEPILKLALEGAGFISAYDRGGMRPLGVRAPEVLDERAAQEIAVKQGLGIVISGSIARAGGGYAVSVKALRPVTGDVIFTATNRTSRKDQVLGATTDLATDVREALGDTPSDDSAQRFAMETLSATSLDVVRHYAAAMESMADGRFEEALTNYSRAVKLDEKFGLGYQGMAVASRGLDRQQDAENYIKEALRRVDSMTERERLRTRALAYMITGDYEKCAGEYRALIDIYAADASARNNLALCATQLRKMSDALQEMDRVIEILPKRALYRVNAGLYAAYGGDFARAEAPSKAALDLGSAWGLQPLAFAQLGQNQFDRAAETYEAMGKAGELGPSYTASGLADLAIYQGRYSEAVRILQAGAAADRAAGERDRAASKFAALAYARLLRQERAPAVAAAENALKNSQTVKIRFLAGRVFVEADAAFKAKPLIEGLVRELNAEPQAYGKILEGNAALKRGDARTAIKSINEANALLNTWIGHFDLGRAYLEAGAFAQADSEFDSCIKRRGEALSLFLDEEPTYGYLPPVYYYQGRVREGLKSAGFAESYRTYLDIRDKAGEDPLLREIRRRSARVN